MKTEIEYLKEHLYEIYKYKKSMQNLTYDMDIEHLSRTCKALDYSQKEIEILQKRIDKAIELLEKYGLVDKNGNFDTYLDTIDLKELYEILKGSE